MIETYVKLTGRDAGIRVHTNGVQVNWGDLIEIDGETYVVDAIKVATVPTPEGDVSFAEQTIYLERQADAEDL